MTSGGGKKIKCPLIGLLAVKNQLITKEELEIGLVQCAKSTDLEKIGRASCRERVLRLV